MASDIVFDADAILALLGEGEAARQLEARLPGAVISSVTLAETIAILRRRGMPSLVVDAVIDNLSLDVAPFDDHQARIAAGLAGGERLSFEARAAIALGHCLSLPVWQPTANVG